jgi:2-polyprenyl-3-methyl-5-hydroxy-6-metoxy-1,4-benzoquinol methylase
LETRNTEASAPPRIVVAIFDCTREAQLRELVARLPDSLRDPHAAICVVASERFGEGVLAREGFAVSQLQVRAGAGAGEARKHAFDRAREIGASALVCIRGDGSHPLDGIGELIAAHREGELLIAARVHDWLKRPAGLPRLRLLAHRTATAFQNRILRLGLGDYHSGLRVVPVAALRRLPYQLADSDRGFEMDFVIQCRALGVPIREHPVPPSWSEYASDLRGLIGVLRACARALDYRLHQLHIVRRDRWFVDRGEPYTLKRSPSSSHMQIVDAIRPGSRVLDLGCSQGLLAGRLRERGVRVVGVDRRDPVEIDAAFDAYYQRDLDAEFELPLGRDFDYVILSDVLEHLRNRRALLEATRRFLVPSGRLIVSTPNIALFTQRLGLLFGRFDYAPRGILDETHLHLYTRAAIRRELARAGFRILRERATAIPFELIFESTGRSQLLRALDRSYFALARGWPALFAYQNLFEAIPVGAAELLTPGPRLQRRVDPADRIG